MSHVPNPLPDERKVAHLILLMGIKALLTVNIGLFSQQRKSAHISFGHYQKPHFTLKNNVTGFC